MRSLQSFTFCGEKRRDSNASQVHSKVDSQGSECIVYSYSLEVGVRGRRQGVVAAAVAVAVAVAVAGVREST
jgi:hypothetical protein